MRGKTLKKVTEEYGENSTGNNNHHLFPTGCSLNIVFFPYNFVIFLNSAGSPAALVFYLPAVCTHTETEGKQRKARVWNILKSSKKHNI